MLLYPYVLYYIYNISYDVGCDAAKKIHYSRVLELLFRK